MKNVIFFGTPEIAVPSLKMLIEAGFNIPLVISQPDKPKGRGKKMQHTAVKEVALEHNIPVYQPEKAKNNSELVDLLKSHNPDFFAVVAYGKILPEEILNIPKYAPVNLHFSLLPLYRGAAPVNRAVLNGDEYTGVDTMKMGIGMDDGDILLSARTSIGRKNAVELSEELSIMGAALLLKTLKEYETITPTEQDHSKATAAPVMNKAEGEIDWAKDAAHIERMTRALVPWPAAYTYIEGKLVKIFDAEVDSDADEAAGMIYSVAKDSFSIGTGKGGLIVKELQMEGKKRMKVRDFLAGFSLKIGMSIG